ncbi:ABC transporter ATP-binding protein [Desulfosporosinus meridiei]|uniref:ABC-type multidrug transport system, ATPase component n=1 Tax=Desulfosporosinus meridiei (strain ATCC BAA-275 / DSM 13257 / KCTC 12902 / NCIMB 13706 / S10) TaxID=768704 RepID=J7ITZ9_DESMD|nr:ABC transporter ATP-binding protein [Desulfosporosinus meridiei]AFQ45302.1 ABC-type multidrug transport system, ATPase component [Desulfosporosinus meridiei DSM 13257]
MGHILDVKFLEKHYGDFVAVNKLNMSIEQGEIFALLGHNGAGKSTLIKMILGLVNPTSGGILIDELEYGQKSKEIKNLIGYLPERMNFYDNLSAWETLTFYAKLKGVSANRCEEALGQVGLADVKHRKVGAFSKGMQQRLGLAQAIIHRPKLLVLDEPTTGLDPIGILELKEMIRTWNKEGTTMFFSSHNLSDVQELAENIAIMHKGSVVAEGSLAKLKHDYRLKTRIEVRVSRDQITKLTSQQLADNYTGLFEIHDNALICYCESQEKMSILQTLINDGVVIEDFSVEEPGLDIVYQKVMNQFTPG